MTAVLTKDKSSAATPWSIMPGWGVVADLTPPELIERRRLKGLRKLIAIVLALVVALVVIGYVFATFKASSAQDSLDETRAAGVALTAEGGKYQNVTRIQSETDAIQAQIATLMTSEVNVARLLSDFRTELPNTLAVTSVTVTLTPGDSSGSTSDAGDPSVNSLSGDPNAVVIGTVTMSGVSRSIPDLADYVVALEGMKGVTNVVPATNDRGAGGSATWTMTLALTDALYTHKYDQSTTSSNGGN